MAEPHVAQHLGAARHQGRTVDCSTPRQVERCWAASPARDDESAEDAESCRCVPKLGGFEVMNRTIDIAQAALARHTLAAYPPDLLIEVPRTACRSLDFHRATEVIEIGQELAPLALDAWTRSTRQRQSRSGTSATRGASRRPWTRPARADGTRHAGSSGLGPKAASDSSSANTASVAPGNASIFGRGRPRTATVTFTPDGTSATTDIAVAARRPCSPCCPRRRP